jgi:hypothetical protein
MYNCFDYANIHYNVQFENNKVHYIHCNMDECYISFILGFEDSYQMAKFFYTFQMFMNS